MTKPSLLFWKLFLAFWLATSLTFLAGVGVIELGSFRAGDPLEPENLLEADCLITTYSEGP